MTNPGLYADYLAKARLSYVVKKHHATRLHYDLRFEYWSLLGKLELASFVIEQGPSLDPTCIRPAIRDRDHDVRYMLSECVIQPGQRGASPVPVWDKGRYRALSGISGQPVNLETALQEGRVVIELEGAKLNGCFELRFVGKHGQEEWSFLKLQGYNAVTGSNIVDEQPNSVLTDRSLEEVRAGVPPQNKSDGLIGTLFDLAEIIALMPSDCQAVEDGFGPF